MVTMNRRARLAGRGLTAADLPVAPLSESSLPRALVATEGPMGGLSIVHVGIGADAGAARVAFQRGMGDNRPFTVYVQASHHAGI